MIENWNLKGYNGQGIRESLGVPTQQFDECGMNNIWFDADANATVDEFIFRGSQVFPDAMSYMEWYEIPHMDEFGLVFIDDDPGNTLIYDDLFE